MRAIDGDALTKRLVEFCNKNCPYTDKERNVMCGSCFMGLALEAVEDASTIEERKTGKWVVDPDGRLHCSACYENPTNRVIIDGRLVYDMTPIVGKMKFCPNCGARMEAET